MTIYERIKALRLAKDMSQLELAYKVGYEGRSAISKVENGSRDISQSMIEKYAAALDVSTYFLLYGEEEPAAESSDGQEVKLSANDKIIIELLTSLSDSKKAEAIRYLRYLAEQSDK